MTEFINGLTGTRMSVSDDRVKEYLAAGHRRVISTQRNRDSSPADDKSKPEDTAHSAPKEVPSENTLHTAKSAVKKPGAAQKQKTTAKK